MNNNPNYKKNLRPFKRHERPYTEQEFKQLYYSGMTITEISEKFGIGRKKVQNDMKTFSVKARPNHARQQAGDKNNNWKGDEAGYDAMHLRKTKLHGQPKKCEQCGTSDERKRYQWASLTGKYQDPNDYKRMCQSCHAKYDNIINNITKGK